MLRRGTRCASQRGLSLVELLVGVAVGLFIVAAAAMLVSNQLANNRRLLLETQVQQDLRATMDIITRELRRAGHSLVMDEWPWAPAGAASNPHQTVTVAGPSEVGFKYDRAPGEFGPYGFRYDPTNFTVESRLAGSGWQDLTDPRMIKVTAFSITDQSPPPTQIPCPKLCAGGTKTCWPTLRVRDYRIDITAQAVSDSAVERSLTTVVRLRNDAINYNDPANPDRICPL